MSLVKDPNVQFVRVRQDFFALAIICPIIFSSKSHFVQPNVVCPEPAVPTFWYERLMVGSNLFYQPFRSLKINYAI